MYDLLFVTSMVSEGLQVLTVTPSVEGVSEEI